MTSGSILTWRGKFCDLALSVTSPPFCSAISNGSTATVAVLPFEIAEQKGGEVTLSARSQNFTLQVRIEPDVTN